MDAQISQGVIFLPYYLAVTPQELPSLPACPLPLVHIAYRIEANGCLSCSAPRGTLSGGLMGLSDCCPGTLAQPERLLRAILRECEQFSGVFADMESALCSDRIAFFDKLGTQLHAQGKKLYLPLTVPAPGAVLLVSTAAASGSLSDRLQKCKSRYGGRVALDLERLRMDYPLPCSSERGRLLSSEELSALRKKHGMSVFFSRDLSTHYFTYTLENKTHFVLFDDAETLKSKMSLGRINGIDTGFFMYPEVKDLLPQLFDFAMLNKKKSIE